MSSDEKPAPQRVFDADLARDLLELHRKVDQRAAELSNVHRATQNCRRGCSQCCLDDLSALEVEAERIQREFPHVLQQEPAPRGQCAFLDEVGECRVYSARPYVCRTQGLPLRWYEEDEQGEIVEERDVCHLNGSPAQLKVLQDHECWQLGPVELELLQLQGRFRPGAERRVTLRALFGPIQPERATR